MNEAKEFLCKAYIDRQQVIFVDDLVYKAKVEAEKKQGTTNQKNFYKAIYDIIFPSYTELLIKGIESLFKSYQEAKSKGLNLNMVPKGWISEFGLPPGHPRNGVLYIAHPAISSLYVPAADFHRFTFEHKFAEALSLLMHLGAKQLKVEHLRGWGHEFAAKLSAGISEARIDAEACAGNKSQTSRCLLYEAELDGNSEPKLPEELVWFQHEPTWQKIAEGRLKFGLKIFSLTLQYQDDFGVNAGLKVKAENAGFDLGGDFQNHESTTWSITGIF